VAQGSHRYAPGPRRKKVLCCRDATLASEGVEEEIDIAKDLTKQIPDSKFIIPLRLEPYKKLFGIAGLQWVDFTRGWGEGLVKLLETFKRQKVPCDPDKIQINPNWEAYRWRGGIAIRKEPERLTSNWLRVVFMPDTIRYFEPTGAVDRHALKASCESAPFPAEPQARGFLCFATVDEVNDAFTGIGRFDVKHECPTLGFVHDGLSAR
jgi:hypothetical protein